MLAVGVDSCRSGWITVAIDGAGRVSAELFRDISAVCAAYRDADLILIDIPIGLSEASPRACDLEARRLLAPRRSSSVFPVPCRAAVYASDYRAAGRINHELIGKGITKQAWNITPKIREVDAYLQNRSGGGPPLRESHPELCFWGLAGGLPMQHPKRSSEGYRERLDLVANLLPAASSCVDDVLASHSRTSLARDDVLDAMALAVSAATGPERLHTVPCAVPCDGEGLPQEIVYPWIGEPDELADKLAAARVEPEQSFSSVLAKRYAEFVQAYERGDAAALVELYTPDAALIEPEKSPIRGRSKIQAELRRWFERFRFSDGRWEVWEYEVLGDTAWDLSYFEMQAARLPGGEVFREQWKQLCLWKRQATTGWRLHRLIFNSHRPSGGSENL